MPRFSPQYRKELAVIQRDMKGRTWGVARTISDDITNFKSTLPLIQDLKNPGMRDRHWRKVMDKVNSTFNPYSDDFRLETIASLGLYNHIEFISNLSASATKEYKIERGLQDIEGVWAATNLDVLPHRDEYLKLSVSEEVFSALEEHQATLGAMKISRFVAIFEKKVEEWERNLSRIAEFVEAALQVQRQWIHLESIFGASQDMKKHLPGESTMFEYVNDTWGKLTKRINTGTRAIVIPCCLVFLCRVAH